MCKKLIYLTSFVLLGLVGANAAFGQHTFLQDNGSDTTDKNIDSWLAAASADSPAYLDTFVEDGLYDIGALSGDITYEFVVLSNPDEQEASMCLIGRRQFGDTQVGLKFDQWNNTGEYGATVFGVVDLYYGIPNNAGEYTHLAFVSSETTNTTFLYINGALAGSIDSAITLSGIVGIGYGAQGADMSGSFDNFDGTIFGVAIYDMALTDGQIAAHSDSYFNPFVEIESMNPGTENLVAYYPFENDVLDASGNGLDGTIFGEPVFVNGKIGMALDLDGVDDYVDCGTNETLNTISDAITVSAWVNIRSVTTTWMSVVMKGETAWRLGVNGDTTGIHWGFTGGDRGWQQANSVTELPFGEWHHIAGTYDRETGGTVWVDGVAEAVNPDPDGVAANGQPLFLGENPEATGRLLDGLLDDVRIYNRALTEPEILYVMEAGDVTSFTFYPYPSNEAFNVPQQSLALRWRPVEGAVEYDVYFGDNEFAVANADRSSNIYRGTQSGTTYSPGILEWGITYYWRVDGINDANPDSPWIGNVWSFETASHFLIVEDFESYTDNIAVGDAIFQTWIDGFGIPDNGAIVGYPEPPYMDRTNVLTGEQSMPVFYNNTQGVHYSETMRTFEMPQDLTAGDSNALFLFVLGRPTNDPELLYVGVSDVFGNSTFFDHPDDNILLSDTWTGWEISLTEFTDAGVDPSNVDRIAIGTGDRTVSPFPFWPEAVTDPNSRIWPVRGQDIVWSNPSFGMLGGPRLLANSGGGMYNVGWIGAGIGMGVLRGTVSYSNGNKVLAKDLSFTPTNPYSFPISILPDSDPDSYVVLLFQGPYTFTVTVSGFNPKTVYPTCSGLNTDYDITIP